MGPLGVDRHGCDSPTMSDFAPMPLGAGCGIRVHAQPHQHARLQIPSNQLQFRLRVHLGFYSREFNTPVTRLGSRASPRPHKDMEILESSRSINLGLRSISVSSVRAGPSGSRTPCSQFLSVPRLKP